MYVIILHNVMVDFVCSEVL